MLLAAWPPLLQVQVQGPGDGYTYQLASSRSAIIYIALRSSETGNKHRLNINTVCNVSERCSPLVAAGNPWYAVSLAVLCVPLPLLLPLLLLRRCACHIFSCCAPPHLCASSLPLLSCWMQPTGHRPRKPPRPLKPPRTAVATRPQPSAAQQRRGGRRSRRCGRSRSACACDGAARGWTCWVRTPRRRAARLGARTQALNCVLDRAWRCMASMRASAAV